MIIREKELLNLKDCPLKFLIGHNGYKVQKSTYNTHLQDLFNYMVSYYFYHGSDKIIDKVENEWANTYANNLQVISEQRWLEGVGFINKIYDFLINSKYKLIDVNVPYVLEFEGIPHIIQGTINNLMSYGDQYITVDPGFSKTPPDKHLLAWDLTYTIHAAAIQQLYDKTPVIIKHNFKLDTENVILRNEKQYNALKLITNNAGEIMENNLIVPDYGYHCSTCVAKGLCTTWGSKEIRPYNIFKDGRKR